MGWGGFEGRRLAELRDELGADLADNERRGLDFRPPGGESPREVAGRLAAFLRELAGDGRGHHRLLVAHKGVLRASLVLSVGWDMLGKPPVRFDPERALLLDPRPRRHAYVRGERAPTPDGGRGVSGGRRCLFWVQSLLGSGHLRRALAVAGALAAEGFDVTLANGGPPSPWPAPSGVDLVQLPSLAMPRRRSSCHC
jgi:hypothetical protein